MRLRLRSTAAFAFIVIASTCSEPTSTGPSSLSQGSLQAARIFVAPQFSSSAVQAYGALAGAGTDITEIHIQLTAPDNTVRDTVIAFPVGQDSIRIDIDVPASGAGQLFMVLLEMRSSDHTVLFSGTQLVTALPANFPGRNPRAVIVSYSGPGKSTKAVSIGPPDTTVSGSSALNFTATAVDSTGKPVSNLLVIWGSTDTTIAKVTQTGNATASVRALSKRGTATISAATLTNIVGRSKVSVVPPATKLVVIAGGDQTAVAGSALPQPLLIEARAADSLPVPGAIVTFRAVTAGGAVALATPVVANAVGRASMVLTLGKTGGSYQYQAALPEVPPVTAMATATPAPAAALAIVSGDGQTDSTATTLAQPLTVKVTDTFGLPVSGATVNWVKIAGNGAVGAASTQTAPDGTTSTTYTLGVVVGQEVVSATVSDTSGSAGTVQFTEHTIRRGPSVISILSGSGQSRPARAVLAVPFVAKVTDVDGNPSASQQVSWSASANNATFNPATSITAVDGTVVTFVTLGSAVGVVTISATSGSLVASTTATITVAAPASIAINGGNSQSATVGTAVSIAPSVMVKDALGNPVPNAPVTFSVASGGGSATGASTTTNAQGIATVGSWTLGTIAGANTLTATSGALHTNFTATGAAGAPQRIALSTGNNQTATVGTAVTTPPAVRVTDASANPVAGVVVTFGVQTAGSQVSSASSSGTTVTVTTDASGIAALTSFTLGTTAQQYLLNATAIGLSGSPVVFAANAVAGTAVQLALVATPPVATPPVATPPVATPPVATPPVTGQSGVASSGVALSQQPAVQFADSFGNTVTTSGVVITASIISGSGTLTNATATTQANGTATFSGLTIIGTAGTFTLRFTGPGVPPLNGGAIVLSAGAAAQFKVTGVPTSITVGERTPGVITVQLADAQNNPVAQAGVTVTSALTTQPGNVINSVSGPTNAAGAIVLPLPTFTGLLGTGVITVSATGIVAYASPAITMRAGVARQLIFTTRPGSTAQSGVPLSPQPVVQLADAGGNPVSATGVAVTVTAINQGGTIGGTSTVLTNASGQAVFTGLTITASPGTVQLKFAYPGYVGVVTSLVIQ